MNIYQPESHRELQVFRFTDVNRDGVLHNGFEIVAFADDLRGVYENLYQAYLFSGNEILVKMPSTPYVFLKEFDMLATKMKDANAHCERTQESHAVARNKIIQDKDRQTKHLLLRFPSEVDLSASPYSSQMANNELDIIVVPYVYQYDLDGRKWTTTGARLSWKVSIIEAEKRVVKASNDTNRAASELSKKLQSMRL